MIDLTAYLLFLGASLVLLLTPGPAVLYIVARSVEQGRLGGIVSVAGVGLGNLAHVIAAAVGVSAIIAASALAFSVLKYLGAAYLIWLGIKTLRTRVTPITLQVEGKPLARLFTEGAIVAALNPKTALFFLAFLPQFIDPARGSAALQTLVLGAVFFAVAFVLDVLYVLAAGAVGRKLKGARTHTVAGVIYLALGGFAARA